MLGGAVHQANSLRTRNQTILHSRGIDVHTQASVNFKVKVGVSTDGADTTTVIYRFVVSKTGTRGYPPVLSKKKGFP